jgi:hypothetical protein
VVDAGVVKPKKIVTGDYVLYSVREHPSKYTDADKPIEIAAMSSNQINKPIFRPYNPDGNEQSELSSQKKMLENKDKNTDMNFKDMKTHFLRTHTDKSVNTVEFKLDITDNNKMFAYVMSYTHKNLGHYEKNSDIDCWEVADNKHCFNFESRMDGPFQPTNSHKISKPMHLGSPASLSPTESCILLRLDAVKEVSFGIIQKILEKKEAEKTIRDQNKMSGQPLVSHLNLTKLISLDGFQRTSEFLAR